MEKPLIVGCGDIGSRIAQLCSFERCIASVGSQASCDALIDKGIETYQINLDSPIELSKEFSKKLSTLDKIYYLVPPQASGENDLRSKHFLAALNLISNNTNSKNAAKRIVLISTTGVYGDHAGEWVDESTPVNPQTDRAKRRLSLEKQWTEFANKSGSILSTLRVPGIYSHSRLPRERLEKQIPIVNPDECGFTNRIHADDLADICVKVMAEQTDSDTYNATDGSPGKISEYLLAAADVLDIPTPPIIPMSEAHEHVSRGMLSYLRESRKISNQKLIDHFNIQLKYPELNKGIHS